MDRENKLGAEWSPELMAALKACRVFVPLYSRRYFESDNCGKEWFAFAQREVMHQAQDGEAVSAVVPALWTRLDRAKIPEVARNFPYEHTDLGERYRSEGFYGIMKLRNYRGDYQRAVHRLAERIIEVGDQSIRARTATSSQALGHQRSAGQGVRAAAGAAHYGEFVQSVGVRDRQHVGGRIRDPSGLKPVGFAVPGPVEGNQLDAEAMQDGRSWPRAKPGCPEFRAEGRWAAHHGRRPSEWRAVCRPPLSPCTSRPFPAAFVPFATDGRIIISMTVRARQRGNPAQALSPMSVSPCSRRCGGRTRRTREPRRYPGSARWGGTRIWRHCPFPARRRPPGPESGSGSGRSGVPGR